VIIAQNDLSLNIQLAEIANIVDGELLGNAALEIKNVRSLESANAHSLCFFCDDKYRALLESSNAGAVLLRRDSATLFPRDKIIVKDPYLAYARISRYFRQETRIPAAFSDTALVAGDAELANDVKIGAYSVIEGKAKIGRGVVIGNHVSIGACARIGSDTVIENNAVVYPNSVLGKRCHLSSGVVIGASGFGYAPDGDRWEKIEHFGHVEIGDDVDIGANTTIDRGTLDNTVIGNRVKLDNHVHIAHNVRIGDDTVMAGCAAVAGSTRIGKRCKLGGRSTVLGHLEVADDVTVYSQSLVTSSIPRPGGYASMISVQPIAVWRKTLANIHLLNKLAKKIKIFGKTSHD